MLAGASLLCECGLQRPLPQAQQLLHDVGRQRRGGLAQGERAQLRGVGGGRYRGLEGQHREGALGFPGELRETRRWTKDGSIM